ncbi:glycosyltransferase [Teredinibacter sp. KSP-S5-2]|uniref:glycosyltransferase n=1 Tax=Teredinibacter sp. KSP-S5-2 TaxID=3034506 RepID=UPI0029345F13|nr:glycosyltransferase [Teredinibacter sp. KSP-S5-2]WNO08121.1 glycosyltransferase [Teredinibacter sp. KSP-S5-2]
MAKDRPEIQRVVFICAYLDGGIGRNIVRLTNYYLSLGLQVSVWVGDLSRGYKDEIEDQNAIVELKTTHQFTGVFETVRLINRFKPDAIIIANERLGRLCYNACKLSTSKPLLIPQVHNIHSQEYLPLSQKKREKRIARMAKLYPKLDGIIAVSKAAATDLSEITGIAFQKIDYILNPVFDKNLEQKLAEYNERIEFKKPTIITVGHIVEQKNMTFLIDSFDIVRKEKDCQLVIIGDGPEGDAVRRRADESVFSQDITMLGHKNNPFPYISASQVFAMSSSFEGFGNVVVEALASGTPVVSTPCGGPEEILLEDFLGEVVSTFDPACYAKALLSWLDKSTDRNKLKQYAAEHFSVPVIGDQYLRYISSLNDKRTA